MPKDTSSETSLLELEDSDDLSSIEASKTIESFAIGTGFFILSKMAYDIQENVYGRNNKWFKTAEALGNPDYLTSFTYPLLLLFAIRTFLQDAIYLSERMGERPGSFILETYKFFLKWAPAFVWSLNVWHEISRRPSYKDNMFSDIMAGSVAIGAYYAYDWTQKIREKKKIAALDETSSFNSDQVSTKETKLEES